MPVLRLRARTQRPDKPLAVMVTGLAGARQLAAVSPAGAQAAAKAAQLAARIEAREAGFLPDEKVPTSRPPSRRTAPMTRSPRFLPIWWSSV